MSAREWRRASRARASGECSRAAEGESRASVRTDGGPGSGPVSRRERERRRAQVSARVRCSGCARERRRAGECARAAEGG